ncbi:MAG: DNA polymerase II [Pseudohongiellaceae bacterium]
MSTGKDRESLPGFILTRQWQETDAGLALEFWLATPSGPARLLIDAQEAVSFLPTANLDRGRPRLAGTSWRHAETTLRNFAGQPLSALYFRSWRSQLECRDHLARQGLHLLEADIKPTDRFLMERFLTGSLQARGEVVAADGFLSLTDPRLRPGDYRPSLRALSIDIETDLTASRLYSIALSGADVALVLMLGEGDAQTLSADDSRTLRLEFFADERALLEAFIGTCARLDPDVLIGWNVVNFDLRCLQQFADRAGVNLALGRNRECIRWRQSRDSSERFYASLPGRLVLDGIELMRSATYSFENFSLDHVARELLKRGKLIDDVDARGAEITSLFETDKPALARYNLEDCRLVEDIFIQEKLLEFAIERSLLTGLEPDRYGGSVAAFDFLYLPRLHRKGYVAPALEELGGGESPGGHVMQSVPGIHDNVIVLDFKSLYPSIIRTFHVDPLALVKGLDEDDAIPGFDGGRFSRHDTILPELIERLWKARDGARQRGDGVMSQAIKIIMNSFYGVLGTGACRFYDARLASSITRRGHEIIIQSAQFIEERGFRVIYGDTDSVFVLLGDVAAETVPGLGRSLAAELNDFWSERIEREHGLPSFLEIEFETHFLRFLMPRIRGSEAGSKKRYAGLLTDGRVLFKGLETVRSDWSPLAREFQQVLYRKIFHDEPVEDYIRDTVSRLLDGRFETELVLRKRLRRKLGDYVKNVPPHVQAARKAERIRKARGLPGLYASGGWIEYVMTKSGPEPRQYRQAPIDYEFYIDRQLAPIADAILVFRSSSLDKVLGRQIGLFQGL